MNFMETAFNQFTGNYRLMKAKISSGAEANTVFFLSLLHLPVPESFHRSCRTWYVIKIQDVIILKEKKSQTGVADFENELLATFRSTHQVSWY